MQLGHAKRELGELAHAEALFLDSLAACRTLGYEHGLAATLIPLIDLAMDRRDLLQAVTYTAESLTLWQAMGLLEGLIDSLLRAGWLAIQGSRHEPAAILLGAGMAMTGSLSYALLRRDRELSETVATSARSAIGEAAFAAALDAGAKLSPAQATARALTLLPELTFSAPRISAPPAPLTTLTARELEVLKLLVAGRTNPEIADSLFVSPVTIRTHVTNILAKLGVSSRTEAAARAVRDGLI
jgi:DNA-binding NarL/FixJ family response regulator